MSSYNPLLAAGPYTLSLGSNNNHLGRTLLSLGKYNPLGRTYSL